MRRPRASAWRPPTCSRASRSAGLIGTQAFDSSALFERDSETRLVALGVDWSFLDVGRVRARIAATDANAAGALARYEQTVLLALEDTENALVLLRARARRGPASRARRHDSARAAQLARVRFDAGAADLLDVLDAERTQLSVAGRLRRRAHAHRDGAGRALPGAGGRLAGPRSGARAGECAVKTAAALAVAMDRGRSRRRRVRRRGDPTPCSRRSVPAPRRRRGRSADSGTGNVRGCVRRIAASCAAAGTSRSADGERSSTTKTGDQTWVTQVSAVPTLRLSG